MRKGDQETNNDSMDHIHQHENTTIVSRHKHDDQIKSILDVFEMLVYRRVLKISWTEKFTNEEVLRRMGTGREIVRQFKTRNLQYLGHIIRHT